MSAVDDLLCTWRQVGGSGSLDPRPLPKLEEAPVEAHDQRSSLPPPLTDWLGHCRSESYPENLLPQLDETEDSRETGYEVEAHNLFAPPSPPRARVDDMGRLRFGRASLSSGNATSASRAASSSIRRNFSEMGNLRALAVPGDLSHATEGSFDEEPAGWALSSGSSSGASRRGGAEYSGSVVAETFSEAVRGSDGLYVSMEPGWREREAELLDQWARSLEGQKHMSPRAMPERERTLYRTTSCLETQNDAAILQTASGQGYYTPHFVSVRDVVALRSASTREQQSQGLHVEGEPDGKRLTRHLSVEVGRTAMDRMLQEVMGGSHCPQGDLAPADVGTPVEHCPPAAGVSAQGHCELGGIRRQDTVPVSLMAGAGLGGGGTLARTRSGPLDLSSLERTLMLKHLSESGPFAASHATLATMEQDFGAELMPGKEMRRLCQTGYMLDASTEQPLGGGDRLGALRTMRSVASPCRSSVREMSAALFEIPEGNESKGESKPNKKGRASMKASASGSKLLHNSKSSHCRLPGDETKRVVARCASAAASQLAEVVAADADSPGARARRGTVCASTKPGDLLLLDCFEHLNSAECSDPQHQVCDDSFRITRSNRPDQHSPLPRRQDQGRKASAAEKVTKDSLRSPRKTLAAKGESNKSANTPTKGAARGTVKDKAKRRTRGGSDGWSPLASPRGQREAPKLKLDLDAVPRLSRNKSGDPLRLKYTAKEEELRAYWKDAFQQNSSKKDSGKEPVEPLLKSKLAFVQKRLGLMKQCSMDSNAGKPQALAGARAISKPGNSASPRANGTPRQTSGNRKLARLEEVKGDLESPDNKRSPGHKGEVVEAQQRTGARVLERILTPKGIFGSREKSSFGSSQSASSQSYKVRGSGSSSNVQVVKGTQGVAEQGVGKFVPQFGGWEATNTGGMEGFTALFTKLKVERQDVPSV